MSRSVWKGPFVDPSLLKKVEKLKSQAKLQEEKRKSRHMDRGAGGSMDMGF